MKTLFDETRIGTIRIRNRLVLSATWEAMADEAGRPTPRLLEVFRELARGGIGLVITSATLIAKDASGLPGMLSLYDDESVFRDYAAEIAKSVEVPVIMVGLNRSAPVLQHLLETTRIGYFSLSRPLLREPDLPKIWKAHPNQPSACTSCDACREHPEDGISCRSGTIPCE